MITVLIHEWVTGGGLAGMPLPASWAAEGGAMRRTLVREFSALADTRVIVMLDPQIVDYEGAWTVVPVGPGEELSIFESLASQADYTLVIAPETDGILAARARVLERCQTISLGSTPEAVELSADKMRMGTFLASRGISTPHCRLVDPATGLPDDFAYPAVLKPRDGAGSVHTYLIESPNSIPDDAKSRGHAILQPLEPGLPMSASFLVGTRSTKLLGVGRQDIVCEDGRFVYQGGTIPAPRDWLATEVWHALEAVAGLRGFVGVDFVYNEADRRACVLEINPRPTTSIVGLERLLPAGMIARSWLELVTGNGGEKCGDMAKIVHAQDPVSFHADGMFRTTKRA